MYSTKQFLDQKGRDVFSISPEAQVFQALEIMAARGIGALVVMNSDGKLVGMLSERDYARKVVLKQKASATTPVSEIMTSRVITVTEDHSLDDCLNTMTRHNIRHLPVLRAGQVVGVLGIGELVQQKMLEKDHQIENLEKYIANGIPYR